MSIPSTPATMALFFPWRHSPRLLRALVAAALVLLPGTSLGGPQDPDGESMEAILRGLAAREEAVSNAVRRLDGEWKVALQLRTGQKPEQRADDLHGTSVVTTVQTESSAIDDERYLEQTRVLHPKALRRTVLKGYDGKKAWTYTPGYGHLLATGPGDLLLTAGWRFTGIGDLLGATPQMRGSARLRQQAPRVVAEELVEGKRCLVVESRPSEPTEPVLTQWICPDYGYAVVQYRREMHSPPQYTPRMQSCFAVTYSKFVRYADDVWIPQATHSRQTVKLPDGVWALMRDVRAEAVRFSLHHQLPLATFQPPAGAK